MSVHFDFRRRIYDLYSFDAPYDLEPIGLPHFLGNYEKELDSRGSPTPVDTEDGENELKGLDLSFDEAEEGRHSSDPRFRLFPDRDRTSSQQPGPRPVLGATLTERKKLLKERIEELVADIHRRQTLEEEMLEKTEVEGAGLEFLLGQVRTWSLGNYPSVDMRRTNLEREILALKKAGWDEQLRCWKDLVMLKKELREALEEYHLVLSAEGL